MPDGSGVDLFVELKKNTSVEEVNEVVYKASKTDKMKNILEYSDYPIVSKDIIGNSSSSIFDAKCTKLVGKNTYELLIGMIMSGVIQIE